MTNAADKEKTFRPPNPIELLESLKQEVVGQDQFLEDAISALYLSLDRIAAIRRGIPADSLLRLGGFVVMAPTGSGKTFGMRRLLETMGLESFEINAADITGTGWKGLDVGEALADVESWQSKHPKEPCVVIFDEADKLVKKDDRYASFDPSRSILKYLESGVHSLPKGGEINADYLVYIFLGAFTGIEDSVRERLLKNEKSVLGFSVEQSAVSDIKNLSVAELRSQATVDDLVSWGFPIELCGRMGEVLNIPELSIDALEQIVKGCKNSLVERFNTQYNEDDEASSPDILTISDGAVKLLAEKTFESKKGARGLEESLQEYLGKIKKEISADKTISRANLYARNGEIRIKYQYNSDASAFEKMQRAWDEKPVEEQKEEVSPKEEVSLCPELHCLNIFPAACTSAGIEDVADRFLRAGLSQTKPLDRNSKEHINARLLLELVIYASLFLAGDGAIDVESAAKEHSHQVTYETLHFILNTNEDTLAALSYRFFVATATLSQFPSFEEECIRKGSANTMELYALHKAHLFHINDHSSKLQAARIVKEAITACNDDPGETSIRRNIANANERAKNIQGEEAREFRIDGAA